MLHPGSLPDLELSPLGSRTSIFTSRLFHPQAVVLPSALVKGRDPLTCAVLYLMHLVCSWEGGGRKGVIEVCAEMKKIHLYLRIPGLV